MKSFREYIIDETVKEYDFYTEDQLLKDIELYEYFNRAINNHNKSLDLRHHSDILDRMIILNENIIEPDKIHIKTNDLEKLNLEYNKFNIFFTHSNELRAVYKQEKDEIEVFVSPIDKPTEIEALLAHEMVHKEQNKRSNHNYFKQSQKMIDNLNALLDTKQKLISEPGGILLYRDKIKKLDNDIKEKYLAFTHLNPFEEMAYACQTIITYSKEYSKLNDIVNRLLRDLFPVTNRFKKYLYQYWIIKDKIKNSKER